ncbi:MAG: hypothetical protein J0H42_33215 [Rhizobiales bacterium]|nr:hypothetical protein [Hyphomicrobiales bacterium]
MSGRSALVRFAVLAGLIVPGGALAQFPPPAGSAGAGPSAISGIPYGPANPASASDPSGIGNASRIPPLRSNPPVPVPTVTSSPSTSRVVAPPYAGASQRITIPRQAKSRRTPIRPRGRVETSTFSGICRGC